MLHSRSPRRRWSCTASNELGAVQSGVSDAVDEATHVVDGEGDVLPPGPRSVTTSTPRVINDPIDPLAAVFPGLAAVEAEQPKKPDCLVEVFDNNPM